MADARELKAKMQAHLDRIKGERESAAKTYEAELIRIDAQIAAAERVLAGWDARVDGLLGQLVEAGIQIG